MPRIKKSTNILGGRRVFLDQDERETELFEDKEYSDEYDIIKSLQTVYDKKKFSLNPNFTLMKGNESKLVEFVTKQHMTARKIYSQIPDKRYAKLAYDLIMLELDDRAIMNRNVKGNMLVEGVINRGQGGNITDKIQEEPKEGFIAGAKSKIKRVIAPDNKTKEEPVGILN